MEPQIFLDNFATIAEAPEGVQRLRDLVLDLAVSGRLVPQDSRDTPPLLIKQDANLPSRRRRSSQSAVADQSLPVPTTLPPAWLRVTAAQLGQLVRGVTYSKSDASDIAMDGTVPLLRAHNIDGSINYEKLVHVPRAVVSDAQLLLPGDHLICMSSGSTRLVGKSAMVTREERVGFGAFCSAFRPIVPSTSPYLAVFLQSPFYRRQMSLLSRGIGINNLRAGDIEQLLIPLPPDSEQERIVASVDELMGLCDRLETALAVRSRAQGVAAAGLTRME